MRSVNYDLTLCINQITLSCSMKLCTLQPMKQIFEGHAFPAHKLDGSLHCNSTLNKYAALPVEGSCCESAYICPGAKEQHVHPWSIELEISDLCHKDPFLFCLWTMEENMHILVQWNVRRHRMDLRLQTILCWHHPQANVQITICG